MSKKMALTRFQKVTFSRKALLALVLKFMLWVVVTPYRISVDPATSIVYWGEIGPDAGNDGVQGPRGYDEFNQAKKAGNYGWPYFVGDSKPYHQYDFATKKVGDLFEPNTPINNST